MGAHSLGGATPKNSGYGPGFWTPPPPPNRPVIFDNELYKLLVDPDIAYTNIVSLSINIKISYLFRFLSKIIN